MLGFSFEKFLIIGVIAVFLIGPQRMPAYAAKLAQFVRSARGMMDNAKSRMGQELGPDFEDIDWKKLDPRQYDPRRIIRTALLDEVTGAPIVDEAAAETAGRAADGLSGQAGEAAGQATEPATVSVAPKTAVERGAAAGIYPVESPASAGGPAHAAPVSSARVDDRQAGVVQAAARSAGAGPRHAAAEPVSAMFVSETDPDLLEETTSPEEAERLRASL
jgi:sec-independent protein translocase protein TatB